MVTKQLREQAAIFCSIMACSKRRDIHNEREWDRDAADYMALLKRYGKSGQLAEAAFFATPHIWPLHEQWALADAMLRTGWLP